MTSSAHIGCAIYTRKSSEEGLEQSFNSLQAQREACEAYIKSQKHEGWHALSTHYDDGGFSGGSMERPALQKLLEDIAAGKVNIVVVYKVDRLTRSLLDFSKIIESFDAQSVSFVSVTQQFNTTTSMGRLTLNVLLSFAQFEREVTGERIRDKIAASKKKGMWMGGRVPLGYDLRDRKLIINPAEAETVRLIFSQYAQLGCVCLLKEYLDEHKVLSKARISAEGEKSGGESFSRGALYQILKNQIYIGRIPHKRESYPGLHQAIIKEDLWAKASALLRDNDRGRRRRGRKTTGSLLTGILFDEHGNRYTPTHAVKKGKRYRYYTSQAVIRKDRIRSPHLRIPAAEIEMAIEQRFLQFLNSPAELSKALADAGQHRRMQEVLSSTSEFADQWNKLAGSKKSSILQRVIRRIVIRDGTAETFIDLEGALQVVLGLEEGADMKSGASDGLVLSAPLTISARARELRFVTKPFGSGGLENRGLVRSIARARSWLEQIEDGRFISKNEISREARLTSSYVTRIFRLASLSPASVEAVLNGEPLVDIEREVPLIWEEQRRSPAKVSMAGPLAGSTLASRQLRPRQLPKAPVQFRDQGTCGRRSKPCPLEFY